MNDLQKQVLMDVVSFHNWVAIPVGKGYGGSSIYPYTLNDVPTLSTIAKEIMRRLAKKEIEIRFMQRLHLI